MKNIVKPLFPVPTLEAIVDNYEEFNQRLLVEINDIFDSKENRRLLSHKWNQYEFSNKREEVGYSNFDPLVDSGLVDNPKFNFFFEHLTPTINGFFSQLNYYGMWQYLNAWAAVYPKGAWVPEHDHRPLHWSAAYYVKTQQEGGEIIFTDPKEYALANEPENTMWRGNNRSATKPTDGMLLVFPSYLKHQTAPNLSDDERVIISFNILTADTPLKAP